MELGSCCSSNLWIRAVRIATLIGACVAHSSEARTAAAQPLTERETLNAALFLAGRDAAAVLIVLASEAPAGGANGIQGWTTRGRDGRGERVFLLTTSPAFQCAMHMKDNFQCRLKLASVIVHEVWHFKHGSNEAEAYGAQLMFLIGHNAALEDIVDVRASRAQAVAAQKKAVDAARRVAK